MRICVISFDFWNYDAHIVDELRKKGIDAHHINIGAYQHRNFPARLKNTFSKIVLQRNLKNEMRQKMILEQLAKLGKQDQILVINPELIERRYHEEIKKFTNKYIAYLYDSLARCPADHLLDLFDEIFSFDKNDAQRHHFKLITNYNYLSEITIQEKPKYDLVYLASFDNRIFLLSKIIRKLQDLKLSCHVVIVGKKTWKKNLNLQINPSVTYTRKRIKHSEIPNYYSKVKVLLDLMRENQTGLSFRIFEAMALKKKIITNNPTVKDYDFYNPENILIIDEDLSNISSSFFEGSYQELSPEIYRKYTLENWVETVFSLK